MLQSTAKIFLIQVTDSAIPQLSIHGSDCNRQIHECIKSHMANHHIALDPVVITEPSSRVGSMNESQMRKHSLSRLTGTDISMLV